MRLSPSSASASAPARPGLMLVLLTLLLLLFAAAAPPAAATPVPRTPPSTQAKTETLPAALAKQPDLSSFAAVLKFIGAEEELAAGTEADIVAFVPANAALDAFARQMIPSNKNATAKDLLNDKYYALLAHVAASHLGTDDSNTGVYQTLGGQRLRVTGAGKARGVSIADDGNNRTANIGRERDLGSAGEIYVVNRVLAPSNVFPTLSAAVKADPELRTFARLVAALTPEIAKSADAGAPATVFAPTNDALANFLASAELTEAEILGDAKLKAQVAATLAYHVVPGVALNSASLADNDGKEWVSLPTALVVEGAATQGRASTNTTKTLNVKAESESVIQVRGGDLSKKAATVVGGGDIFAGADVVHKIDRVLVPGEVSTPPPPPPPRVVGGGGRKLLRTRMRNNIANNTQRSNIRRVMRGDLSVGKAARANTKVGQLTTMGRVPNFYLTQAATRGGKVLLEG